jgi:hypothetical protein
MTITVKKFENMDIKIEKIVYYEKNISFFEILDQYFWS